MNRIFTTLLSGILLLGLGACGNLRIQTPVAYSPPSKVNRIGLVASYMTPLEQPRTPVADASTFNKKTDELAKDLKDLMQEKLDAYYLTLAAGLEQTLGVTTAKGEELNTGQRYERALKKEEKEALLVPGGGPYNRIMVGKGGFNSFPFKNGEVAKFLKESPRLRSVARSLSRDLQSEIIAISHHHMVIEKPMKFGAEAKAKLQVDIYLFDDRGEVVGHGYGETIPMTITGDDLAEYEAVLDQYPDLQNQILTALAESKIGGVEEVEKG